MNQDVKNIIQNITKDSLVCPSNIDDLNQVIEFKNKLTKQLNNLYNQLNTITNILKPSETLIDASNTGITIAQTAIDALQFIPSTSVTPIPVAPILQGQKIINTLRKLIGNSENKVTQGNSSISSLTNQLQQVINLLELVDMFIESCANKLGEDTITQEQISEELLKSTQEQSNELSPVVTNVNGFDMGVITVDSDTNQSLKRRRAVARNSQGVIMLQGEPSYSSNDQILIDELVFYIQQNDLKA